MKREVQEASHRFLTYIDAPATERCSCPPLSSLHGAPPDEQEEEAADSTQVLPATPELNNHLRMVLSHLFPRSTPLSVLLLHISQFEHIHKSATSYQRLCYHAADSFLEQVLINIRRTIRASDQILAHAGTGAAIIFPYVDQQGMYGIAERVFQSIDLLQAETVIPPLRRVTDILMGIGSYPEPGPSVEHLLYHTGLVARKLTLRPAITSQARSIKLAYQQYRPSEEQSEGYSNERSHRRGLDGNIPFMDLPAQLPRRLKQLIPYHIALRIRCAPVGRNHNHLTIAMANPTDTNALCQLSEITGLTIFAVACEVEALDALLEHTW